MAVVIDGTTGITMPAGGLANTAGAAVGTTDSQTLTNKTIQGGALTLATAVSASGTSVDFTGIPSWAKRITVMFDGLSTNGSALYLLRLGDSGGIETTGYSGSAAYVGAGTGTALGTSGIVAYAFGNVNNIVVGSIQIVSMGSNRWVANGVVGNGSFAYQSITAYSKTLSDTLTQLSITTANGTDTFDAGTINIMYEG
jgi:hypothetical protein